MFGKNLIINQNLREDGGLIIVSLFYTIQGEGPYSGMPAVFLRLAGCNLRCTFCDTDFETGAQLVPAKDIVERVLGSAAGRTRLVVITGGEPLIQNVVPLIKALTGRGMRAQIETAGTVWVPGLEECDFSIVCSPKAGKVNKHILEACNHFKYIVGANDMVTEEGVFTATQPGAKPAFLARPKEGATVWIQPRDDQDAEKNRENVMFARDICLKYGHRLSMQVHKLIEVD